jgi:hypothetical protein
VRGVRTWIGALAVVGFTAAFFVSGCQFAQWRVFEKKVDGKDAVKPAHQVEGEKRAAAYIVARTTPPVADPAGAVQDVNHVAVGLSASLGVPDKPVAVEDKAAVVAALTAGLKAKEAQLEKWREFGRKYAGKPLEDTGINLAGPAGLLAVAGVAAACIFVPGFGWVLLRLLPVLWGALRRAVGLVEAAAEKAPELISELKQGLPSKEDAARKIIRKAKITA